MKIVKETLCILCVIFSLILPMSDTPILAVIGWVLLLSLVFYVISREKGTIPNLIIRDVKESMKELKNKIIAMTIKRLSKKLDYYKALERRA